MGVNLAAAPVSPAAQKYTINSITNLGGIVACYPYFQATHFENDGYIYSEGQGSLLIAASDLGCGLVVTNQFSGNYLYSFGGITLSAQSMQFTNSYLYSGLVVAGTVGPGRHGALRRRGIGRAGGRPQFGQLLARQPAASICPSNPSPGISLAPKSSPAPKATKSPTTSGPAWTEAPPPPALAITWSSATSFWTVSPKPPPCTSAGRAGTTRCMSITSTWKTSPTPITQRTGYQIGL